MTPDASTEALQQLQLRYQVMAAAADAYAKAGFTVVIDDVVVGQDLSEYLRRIGHRPCHLVVLLPSREAIEGASELSGARVRRSAQEPCEDAGV